MKCLLFSFTLLLGLAGMALGQDRLIENDGFGLFAAAEGTEGHCAVLFLHNDDCVGSYKVANGEVIIGEGQVDFRKEAEFDIPFGANLLQVSCIGGNRLRISVE